MHSTSLLAAIFTYERVVLYIPLIIGSFICSCLGSFILFFSMGNTMVFDAVRGSRKGEVVRKRTYFRLTSFHSQIDSKNVPMRIAIVSAGSTVCSLLAQATLTVLRSTIGTTAFTIAVIMSTACVILALLHVIFFTNESMSVQSHVELSGEFGKCYKKAKTLLRKHFSARSPTRRTGLA